MKNPANIKYEAFFINWSRSYIVFALEIALLLSMIDAFVEEITGVMFKTFHLVNIVGSNLSPSKLAGIVYKVTHKFK